MTISKKGLISEIARLCGTTKRGSVHKQFFSNFDDIEKKAEYGHRLRRLTLEELQIVYMRVTGYKYTEIAKKMKIPYKQLQRKLTKIRKNCPK